VHTAVEEDVVVTVVLSGMVEAGEEMMLSGVAEDSEVRSTCEVVMIRMRSGAVEEAKRMGVVVEGDISLVGSDEVEVGIRRVVVVNAVGAVMTEPVVRAVVGVGLGVVVDVVNVVCFVEEEVSTTEKKQNWSVLYLF
jgi:hypothetical protein